MSDRDRQQDEGLPRRDQEKIDEEAQKNRDTIDDVPPHGTDPLHEGP
jgi:hypothetical protein